MKNGYFKSFLLIGLALLVVSSGQVFADRTANEPEAERVDTGEFLSPLESETGFKKPIPLTFMIDYTLASNYIFRGANLSDPKPGYAGQKSEGGRWPNQQLLTGVELDLGQFGRVGGNIFLAWYCGQPALTPEDPNDTFKQVNYYVYYGYLFRDIGLDVQVGFRWIDFRRNGVNTREIDLKLSLDDSVLMRALGFDVDGPVLNPYLYMVFDLEHAAGGVYYQLGMSHAFSLAKMGMKDTPFLKDITIIPSMSISGDHHYLNKWSALRSNSGTNQSQLDRIVYGLDVSYNLKNALGIPDEYCGCLYVKGFVNYQQRLDSAKDLINDELWGGVSLGYSW